VDHTLPTKLWPRKHRNSLALGNSDTTAFSNKLGLRALIRKQRALHWIYTWFSYWRKRVTLSFHANVYIYAFKPSKYMFLLLFFFTLFNYIIHLLNLVAVVVVVVVLQHGCGCGCGCGCRSIRFFIMVGSLLSSTQVPSSYTLIHFMHFSLTHMASYSKPVIRNTPTIYIASIRRLQRPTDKWDACRAKQWSLPCNPALEVKRPMHTQENDQESCTYSH